MLLLTDWQRPERISGGDHNRETKLRRDDFTDTAFSLYFETLQVKGANLLILSFCHNARHLESLSP